MDRYEKRFLFWLFAFQNHKAGKYSGYMKVCFGKNLITNKGKGVLFCIKICYQFLNL